MSESNPRRAGVLLHVTSLPSPYGIGDLGPEAFAFVDFLASAGQTLWQILPLTPTATFLGDSPYSSPSVFAGNPLLVSPELLARKGLVRLADLQQVPAPTGSRVDYAAVTAQRRVLLDAAFDAAAPGLAHDRAFQDFVRRAGPAWLDDYALFQVVKDRRGGESWHCWPEPLRDRDPAALDALRDEAARDLAKVAFEQHLFFSQWHDLKAHAARSGVAVVGDMPFYPTFDSADCWANPGLFKLGPDRQPTVVAGVPPDYFSATGQRWGNPVYRWEAMAKAGYAWWMDRLAHNLELADMVRLDHFRAFSAHWEIPAQEKTAVNGRWVDGPGAEFFIALKKRFRRMPVIAEDLGMITEDVRALRRAFSLPGMRVLMFAFGADLPESDNAWHHHDASSVAYTGTHDNNTVRGWFEAETSPEDRARMAEYMGHEPMADTVAWDLVRLCMLSVAPMAVAPMQDLLGLSASGRMNVPAVANGNWGWRMERGAASPDLAARLRRLTELSGRLPAGD